MEDGVYNGMIIYIILTKQIIAAEFSIKKFNYIPLQFDSTAKRCTEIFPDSFLGKNKLCYKESLKILEEQFSSSVSDLVEMNAVQDTGYTAILLINLKALTI